MIQSIASPSPKNLILITNHFPYGTGEAFLENEIPYLIRSFDKVVILTRNVNASTRPVTEVNFSHERIDPESKIHLGNGPCRSEEHTSELQSHSDLVCRLLLE